MLRLEARAKVNLMLDVLGRRPDGYHEIRSIMVPVALHDDVSVRPARELSVECDDPGVPTGEANLAYRAAALAGQKVHIRIKKRIPVAAGLGGGSADAAAVLRALNVDGKVADQLGSDVPFCLVGRPALATGRGERLTFLPLGPPIRLLLARPRVSVPADKTAAVYREFRPEDRGAGPDEPGLLRALAAGDAAGVAARLYNALEPAACRLWPAIADLKGVLLPHVRGVALTGSGPTLVAVVDGGRTALQAAKAAGAWAVVTTT